MHLPVQEDFAAPWRHWQHPLQLLPRPGFHQHSFRNLNFFLRRFYLGSISFVCLSSCKQKCRILCWARKPALMEHELHRLKQYMTQGEVQCGVEVPFTVLVPLAQQLWLMRVNDMLLVSCRVWGHQDKMKGLDQARLSQDWPQSKLWSKQ